MGIDMTPKALLAPRVLPAFHIVAVQRTKSLATLLHTNFSWQGPFQDKED